MRSLRILEIGFGTGLNAWLTMAAGESRGVGVHYTTIEIRPLQEKITGQLNYPFFPGPSDPSGSFRALHQAPWNEVTRISPAFTLEKILMDAQGFTPRPASYDVVYHDAFSPDVQPGLWSGELFTRMFTGLDTGGILVTYSVKGEVVRTMKQAGFRVEKLPGPPGKRHILRAQKI